MFEKGLQKESHTHFLCLNFHPCYLFCFLLKTMICVHPMPFFLYGVFASGSSHAASIGPFPSAALPAIPLTSLLVIHWDKWLLQALTLEKMPAELILESILKFWVIDILPSIPSTLSSPPSPHPPSPLCFFFVSLILSAHWSVFGADTPGRVWICSFLETSGHPHSRDPLTFCFESFLCSRALWASFSFSASNIPNCHSTPQWPRCRYRIKKAQWPMLYLLDKN